MKTRFLFLALLLVSSMVNAGCTPARQPVTAATPSLRIDQPVYNFGSVSQGQRVTHEFTFTNVGREKLVINHVESACSCTVALLSSREFLPGASGMIRVTFDSSGYLGSVTKTITIMDNDPAAPSSVLTIAGNVVTDIMSEKSALFFGSIRKGREERQYLSVFISNPAVKITAVTSTNPAVQVSAAGVSVSQETLKVTVTQHAGYGPLNTAILVFSTSKEHPVLQIPLIGNITGDILVNPDLVDFGVVTPGGEHRALPVYLYSQPQKAFSITRITAVPGSVHITSVRQNPGKYKLLVTLSKTKTNGTVQGVITVRTTMKTMPVIAIPFQATLQQGQ